MEACRGAYTRAYSRALREESGIQSLTERAVHPSARSSALSTFEQGDKAKEMKLLCVSASTHVAHTRTQS